MSKKAIYVGLDGYICTVTPNVGAVWTVDGLEFFQQHKKPDNARLATEEEIFSHDIPAGTTYKVIDLDEQTELKAAMQAGDHALGQAIKSGLMANGTIKANTANGRRGGV